MPVSRTSGGEATRQALIDASYRLFTSKGYHATSIRDIASEAGITAGSIYNHFSDKDQIIKEVILTYHPITKVMPVLEQVEGHSADELIRDAAHRMMNEIDSTPGLLNLMYIEVVELRGRHMEDLVSAMFPLVQAYLMRVYSMGNKIRPKHPVTFIRAFIGMLLGYGISRMFLTHLPDDQWQDATLDEFIDVFLHGVLE